MRANWLAPIIIIAVVCLTLPAYAAEELAEEVRLDGYHLVQVRPTSWDQIEKLHELGAVLVSCNEGLGPVDYALPKQAMRALRKMRIKHEVMHTDIQVLIDEERARMASRGRADPRSRAWFDDHPLNEIEAKLQAFVTDRPDLCSLIDIGDSVEGRDIWALRISGSATTKPAVCFNGGQHAREWISPAVNMYIADKLVYEYDTDPVIQSIVDRVEFFIIPVMNPDGYVHTHDPGGYRLWRKNRKINLGGCIGVDLNRNWAGVGWAGPSTSPDPCNDLYHGPSPFSEPESQAISNFYLFNPQIVAGVDYHSYGQDVAWPYGYTAEPCADNDVFAEVGYAMQQAIYNVHGVAYSYGAIGDVIYPVGGGSVDWMYDDAGAYALTIELRPEGSPYFELPPEFIIPTAEENFPAAMVLAEFAATPIIFSYPGGLPAQVEAGMPIDFPVKIKHISGAAIQLGTERVYYRLGGAGPFTDVALVPAGGDLYDVSLPAIGVGESIQYYFEVQTTDAETHTDPVDAPTSVHAASAVEVAYSWNLDTDPGWSTEGLWAWGQPTGGGGVSYGGPDPISGHTGTNVYGYNLTGDYTDNMPEYHLTSTAIDCSDLTSVEMRFWRWLNVEQAAYDHAYVRVSNDGTNWTTVWQNSTTIEDASWQEFAYDISSVADGQATVYLRWTMGSTDSGWRFSGWNIDDVQIRGASPPVNCPEDLDGLNGVGQGDLNAVLNRWGDAACLPGGAAEPCPEDLDGLGGVGQGDLNAVLNRWGDPDCE